jgi:hypothetical protein
MWHKYGGAEKTVEWLNLKAKLTMRKAYDFKSADTPHRWTRKQGDLEMNILDDHRRTYCGESD